MRKRGYGLDVEQSKKEDADKRNFTLGAAWDYKPKQVRVLLPTRSIREQGYINSCVAESIATQKEQQEATDLSSQFLFAFLRSKGLANENGTSLDAAQKALQETGIAEKRFGDEDRSSFARFSRAEILTKEAMENAAWHKTKSYWRAPSLGNVLEQLDEGRIGQTGALWYSSYNELYGRRVLQPFIGRPLGGHAFAVVGYDTDFDGQKVVICQNSFGQQYGDKGLFYIRFSDFERICTFTPRFCLDIDKDLASWLSLNAGRGIIELNSPKVWLIQGDRKRYIEDIGLMFLLGVSPEKLVHDADNLLPQVQEGNPMSVNDIPPYRLLEMKRLIQLSEDKPILREIKKKYFPDLA